MPELDFLTSEDQQIIDQLRRNWRDEIDPIKKQVQSLIQRSSRPPGVGLERGALDLSTSLGQQLAHNTGFQAFVKSAIGFNSSFLAELRLPPNRKAAAPVSGLSPTEYFPSRLFGPAMFPLRLREILPIVPVTSGVIEYTQETSFTPSAAVVPETQLKPPLAITFTEALAKCSTIAQFVKVSRQSLMDVAQMQKLAEHPVGLQRELERRRHPGQRGQREQHPGLVATGHAVRLRARCRRHRHGCDRPRDWAVDGPGLQRGRPDPERRGLHFDAFD